MKNKIDNLSSGGKMKKNNFLIRLIFYVLGILVLTLGIALTMKSNLGTSPMDALLVGLHNSFGLTVGSWEYIIGLVLLIINSIVVGQRPHLLALSTAVFVGIGIDLWLLILASADFLGVFYFNIASLLIGTVFSGLGISTYLQADFLASPFDESMLVISQQLNVSLFWGKTILMTLFLILAFFFKGPIAIGTIITLVMSGPMIGFFHPRMAAFKIKIMEVIL